jgi:hypothetical protein
LTRAPVRTGELLWRNGPLSNPLYHPPGIQPEIQTVAAVTQSILNSLRYVVRKLLRHGHARGHIREAAAPPLQPFEMTGIPQFIDSCMSHFLLTFGDPSQPPFAAAIIEAPSMAQARMTAVVRRMASDLPFGEGIKLNDKMTPSIAPNQIGRILSGDDAIRLILQLAELQRNTDHSRGSTASA